MNEAYLLHELITVAASRQAEATALTYGQHHLSYSELQHAIENFARALMHCNLQRGERVAIYLEKRFETVIASFGAAAAGCVFVPLNPILKPEQVAYILQNCNVRLLVTSKERLEQLDAVLDGCPDLRHVVSVNGSSRKSDSDATSTNQTVHDWTTWLDNAQAGPHVPHRVIDSDMVAILYTSGSTGKPKGVVLSHRNMVAGAKSVASYLDNRASDTLLAALPLSFDAGFSQLTTAFHAGARVVLLNYLLPRDVLKALVNEKITGLTAVPPLYIQLAQLQWPAGIDQHLRYFANTGGRMPRATLDALRAHLPQSQPFLMYGLTEAFRSTYLPPEEVDRRPDSIGKAIPNAEIMVLREDGSVCAPGEPGELVHRGALVGMGYWNDVEKTQERYKPLPGRHLGATAGLVLPELAVFSGDTVQMDEEGFLYFIGRRDEMIKTSGYRVSPTEIEELLYATGLVAEAAAFGMEHETLGQAIVVIVTPKEDLTTELSAEQLLGACRKTMPAYMLPSHIDIRSGPLPRNPNGKIDRKTLSGSWSFEKKDQA